MSFGSMPDLVIGYPNNCSKNIGETTESNMFHSAFPDCLYSVLVIFIWFLGPCVADLFKEWENPVFLRPEMVMMDESQWSHYSDWH